MQTIIAKMNTPLSGFLAFITGGTITITEVVREGSIWLTFAGAILAFVGGIWTYNTAKIRFKIEITKLKQAEIEFEKACEVSTKKRTHPRS